MSSSPHPPAAQSGNDPQVTRSIFDTLLHMGVATAITGVLGLLLKLLLPRFLGPEEVGRLYFVEAMAAMFFCLMPLGISSYISREIPKDPSQAQSVLKAVLPLQLFLGVLMGAGLLLFLSFSGSEPRYFLLGLGMAVFTGALSFHRSILSRIFISLGRSAEIARTEVGSRILLVALVLAVLVFKGGATAVAWSYALAQVLALLWLLHGLLPGLFHGFAFGGFSRDSYDQNKMKHIVSSSLPFFAVAALVEIYGNIDIAMLKYLASHGEVALYGSANKLKSAALFVIPVLQAAIQPALARTWSRDQDQFSKLVSQSTRALIVILLPVSMTFLVIPDWITRTVFGLEFTKSAFALACMSPVLLLTSLNVLMGSCLNIVSSGVSFLFLTSLSILLNIALNYGAITFAYHHYGVGAAAGAAALASVVSELFVLLGMRKIFKVGLDFKAFWKLLALAFLPFLVLGLSFESVLLIEIKFRVLGLFFIVPAYLWWTGLLRKEDLREIEKFIQARKVSH